MFWTRGRYPTSPPIFYGDEISIDMALKEVVLLRVIPAKDHYYNCKQKVCTC